ncbi:MAG: hypothetical protein R3D44_00420 [Hyphomicrobiaceae bacterium]
MAVFDCFLFCDELDILEIRLTELWPHVDYFVLAEATETFSGHHKPLYFRENKRRFERFLDKIVHIVVDDLPPAGDAWQREAHQRNALARGLDAAEADDIVMLSDVDEIPYPHNIADLPTRKTALREIRFIECDYYQFRLNLAVENKWVGLCATRVIARKHLPPMQTLRAIRARQSRRFPWSVNQAISVTRNLVQFRAPLRHVLVEHGGWHFTSIGSIERLQRKIASYAHQERNTPEFNSYEHLARLYADRLSICGRHLRKVDLSLMPASVSADLSRWQHLLEA